jgi:hypothetical protein
MKDGGYKEHGTALALLPRQVSIPDGCSVAQQVIG